MLLGLIQEFVVRIFQKVLLEFLKQFLLDVLQQFQEDSLRPITAKTKKYYLEMLVKSNPTNQSSRIKA